MAANVPPKRDFGVKGGLLSITSSVKMSISSFESLLHTSFRYRPHLVSCPLAKLRARRRVGPPSPLWRPPPFGHRGRCGPLLVLSRFSVSALRHGSLAGRCSLLSCGGCFCLLPPGSRAFLNNRRRPSLEPLLRRLAPPPPHSCVLCARDTVVRGNSKEVAPEPPAPELVGLCRFSSRAARPASLLACVTGSPWAPVESFGYLLKGLDLSNCILHLICVACCRRRQEPSWFADGRASHWTDWSPRRRVCRVVRRPSCSSLRTTHRLLSQLMPGASCSTLSRASSGRRASAARALSYAT